MPHWKSMYDSKWVTSFDLQGRDVTVVIDRVEAGKVQNKDKEEKKPVIWFRGASKPFASNKTNSKTIAGMYGNDTKDWIGKAITLYPTMTKLGREDVDCIRVRPTVPKQKAQDMPNPEPPAGEREAGQEG